MRTSDVKLFNKKVTPLKGALPPSPKSDVPETARYVSLDGDDIQRVRRRMLLERRLHGWSIRRLAADFNINEMRVRKELSKAKKENLLKEIEDRIVNNLAQKALDLYNAALDDHDLFVAKDVLQHVQKIADRKQRDEGMEKGMSLQVWLQARKEEMHAKEGETKEIDVTEEVLLLPSASEEEDHD